MLSRYDAIVDLGAQGDLFNPDELPVLADWIRFYELVQFKKVHFYTNHRTVELKAFRHLWYEIYDLSWLDKQHKTWYCSISS